MNEPEGGTPVESAEHEPTHGLRWARLNAGLTLNELAASAAVSQGTVSRLEHGERAPLHAIEQRVAFALGVEPDSIAWGTDADDEESGSLGLVELREDRKLRPNDIAARTGVPLRTLRRAEAGAAIHPRYAKRLADFYGCRVTDFYPGASEAVA
jgi:transcriptional regulator with XRE-family HTH domain